MKLELFCTKSLEDVYLTAGGNADYTEVEGVLDKARGQGHSVVVRDMSGKTEDERWKVYSHLAAYTLNRQRYAVSRIFGSNAYGGRDFGKGTPCLAAYADDTDEHPTDIYPHEYKDGRVETIASFLRNLLNASQA